MTEHWKKWLAVSVIVLPVLCFSQTHITSFVNPFIGTAKSDVYTRWGNEGGTYPGAVAPWGGVQVTPETRNNGYDYNDTSIQYFSCINHHSGFPGGSHGDVHLMPVKKPENITSARFSHAAEEASPGYYKVWFEKEKIQVEATATTHCGVLRFTFAAGVTPYLVLTDAGEIKTSSPYLITSARNLVLQFDQPVTNTKPVQGGVLLTFQSGTKPAVITLQFSASQVSTEGAEKNMLQEGQGKSFEEIKTATQQQWNELLSVVDVNDSSQVNKEMFYTALYHSLLMPWVISDVDGRYRGSDGRVHLAKEKHEYGGFSPWDTFRSLHPLLSFLFPRTQASMMQSMMDVYEQSGYLPTESMTGNHSIPILVDSYRKGIHSIDRFSLYRAMKKSIVDTPFSKDDMSLYQQGFIPYPHTESVTRTVEYAYDDWALAQYAKSLMQDDSLYQILSKRSRNYRNLFDAAELSLLPRRDSVLYHGTANAGYKEGDQWVYSLFLPQYQQELMNLFGGDKNFIKEVDNEFADRRLVFDNETLFHLPYLFNATAYPYKTQQCVNNIRHRFTNKPGGLPGNDDLGSTSSWFVWSALGLYPVCPGNPVYAIGTPLFKSVALHLPGGKRLQIDAENLSPNHYYVRQLQYNGRTILSKYLHHDELRQGGELHFTMIDAPDTSLSIGAIPGETDSCLSITAFDAKASQSYVKPNESFWIKYHLKNNGGAGTAITRLLVDDTISLQKNSFVQAGEQRQDSIECRLYGYGDHRLQIDSTKSVTIKVIREENRFSAPQIFHLQVSPLVSKGDKITCRYSIKNVSGETSSFSVPVLLNNRLISTDTILLKPGDSLWIYHSVKTSKPGLFTLRVMEKKALVKVFDNATDAIVLNVPEQVMDKNKVRDKSGFQNDGQKAIIGNYITLPHSASLDSNSTTLTMMEWVYDEGNHKPLTELLAKGDNHVLQLVNDRQLTFFAGGWGRGDCTVPLPEDWRRKWHHIAGVCNGKELQVYIDGSLAGTTALEEMINLNVPARWTIGSNEEFPLDRTFAGEIKGVKIFAAALSAADIQHIYREEKE